MSHPKSAALPACLFSSRSLAFALVGLAGLLPEPALAEDFTLGPLTVSQPWSRATPGSAKVAVGYLTITNAGDAPDRLTAIGVDVAAQVSAHTMSMKGDTMVMRPITGGVLVPAHGTVSFKPGADHLMIEGLKHPLKQGERFAGTLTFEKAGALPVTFEVESIGAQAPAAQKP